MRRLIRQDRLTKISELISLPGFEDPILLASTLVTELSSLPQKLRVMSSLPSSFSEVLFHDTQDLEIGPGIRVVRGDKLEAHCPLSTGSARLDEWVVGTKSMDRIRLTKDGHYFVTWHSGYVGGFFQNAVIQAHLDKLRSMLGLLLAIDALEEDYTEHDMTPYVVVHQVGDSTELALTSSLDSDVSYLFDNYGLEVDLRGSFRLDFEESGEELLEVLPLSEEEEERKGIVQGELRTAFGGGELTRRILTSSLWLFRAFTTSRKMDVILNATIALEVLLGDREEADRIGLTKLMSNRCAYLLGSTKKERDEIMESFKGIYELRSKIVHTGMHHTDRAADRVAHSARLLAARVIKKELELVRG